MDYNFIMSIFNDLWTELNWIFDVELFSFHLSDINDCDPNPCVNEGVCNNGNNSYTCTCAEDYTGKNCSESIS